MDNVSGRWSVFCSDRCDKRSDSVGDADLAAGADRRCNYNRCGICLRLHHQYLAGMECMGLFRTAGKYTGADLPAILCGVDTVGSNWDCSGRLSEVLVVWRRKATLPMEGGAQMTMQEIWEIIEKSLAVLASVGVAVEIFPPIKLKPWSYILRKIGAAMNGELIEKVDNLQKQMTSHEIDELRWNILNFANDCRHGTRHTKEEFDHVIKCHTEYEKIIEENGLENGQVDTDYKYIEKIYYKCMVDNDFL